MKNIENLVEIVDAIIPQEAKKVVFFCEVEENAYECFYYMYSNDNKIKQCFELAEDGVVDSTVLDATFAKVVQYIKQTSIYDTQKRNVVTIIVEGKFEKVETEQFEKSVGLYKIKKEWKSKYITL